MRIKFSVVTEGKTKSISHKIGFSYGINTSFTAGFLGFTKMSYEASFSFSHEHAFAESASMGISQMY